MKEINVRDLLRHFKRIFPIPADGIKVKRKRKYFYIFKENRALVLLDVIDGAANRLPQPPPDIVVPPPVACNWNLIMGGSLCDSIDTKHVKITSLVDGAPTPNDWEDRNFCEHHLNVIKTTNLFSIENE